VVSVRARVAALVVASLALSGCSILGFGDDCGGTEIIGEFEQVGDLVENSNVQSSDVEIGTVRQIELSGWTARVRMCLDEAEKISADTDAVVRTTSLLGEKFIDLKEQSPGPPFLQDGDVIGIDRTSKATELEDVFARLATVLGTGNLHKINEFVHSQAVILQNHEDDIRTVLHKLRVFTDALADRQDQIAAAVDSLDAVSRNVLNDRRILQRFLDSFADASGILASNKAGLQELIRSLDRFSNVSLQLLNATEQGLDQQFDRLRPVLRTAAANSRNLRRIVQTLATFSDWFPETMPGDYLQLDVCQAGEEDYDQGRNCPQSVTNDNPNGSGGGAETRTSSSESRSGLELILRRPVEDEG
jgi:phospholipid/cholesterol/gamma-HCH transport system substrate-binding protein